MCTVTILRMLPIVGDNGDISSLQLTGTASDCQRLHLELSLFNSLIQDFQVLRSSVLASDGQWVLNLRLSAAGVRCGNEFSLTATCGDSLDSLPCEVILETGNRLECNEACLGENDINLVLLNEPAACYEQGVSIDLELHTTDDEISDNPDLSYDWQLNGVSQNVNQPSFSFVIDQSQEIEIKAIVSQINCADIIKPLNIKVCRFDADCLNRDEARLQVLSPPDTDCYDSGTNLVLQVIRNSNEQIIQTDEYTFDWRVNGQSVSSGAQLIHTLSDSATIINVLLTPLDQEGDCPQLQYDLNVPFCDPCLAEEDVYLEVIDDRACYPEGENVVIEIVDNETGVRLVRGTREIRWALDGELQEEAGETRIVVEAMALEQTVTAVIAQAGCADFELSILLTACDCPTELPGASLIFESSQSAGNESDGRACWVRQDNVGFTFTVLGLDTVDRFNQIIWQVSRQVNPEGDREVFAEDFYTISGANAQVLEMNSEIIPEGVYEVEARIFIRGCINPIIFENNELVICPKNLSLCPGVTVSLIQDNEGQVSFLVEFGDPEYVRQNGFVIDYGDGTEPETVSPELASRQIQGDRVIINHAYREGGDYTFTIIFPEFGADLDCKGALDVVTEGVPENGNSGGNGDGDCPWYRSRCWEICDFIGLIFAMALAALLLLISIDGLGFLGDLVVRAVRFIAPGVDFENSDGLSISVASSLIFVFSLVYLRLCGECKLARYILLGTTLFLLAFLVTLFATGALVLAGSVAAMILATGLTIGALVVLDDC